VNSETDGHEREAATAISVVLVGGARAGVERLQAALPTAVIRSVEPGAPQLPEALSSADAIVADALTARDLSCSRGVKLIQVPGAGYDGIELDAVPPGCTVCNVFEHEIAIGEWVLMEMLALTRHLLSYDKGLREGLWTTAHRFEGDAEHDLRGRTIGLIGLGHIGSEVARLGRAIGMEAVGVTRNPNHVREAAAGLRWLRPIAALDELLHESDFAVVALPLTPGTRSLIGREELRLLGPDGYLINVSRGPIVDEEALFEALRTRAIAGAAIDVWYRYPAAARERTLPSRFPFWALENVVMTPHVAGFARSTVERRWSFIVSQLEHLQAGLPLENAVAVGSREIGS
jgi:phosphoglycerate dehydrogenase-like enzyme